MIDKKKLESELNRFSAFVQYRNYMINGTYGNVISFTDKSTFPGNEEAYKMDVAIEAKEILHLEQWESLIDQGKIGKYVVNALNCGENNLVHGQQKTKFYYWVDSKYDEFKPEAESVLYDIFCGHNDEAAFNRAAAVFEKHYDLVSWMFFIKNPEKYIPVRSGSYDAVFKSLGIDYTTRARCSWENYCGLLDIMHQIQSMMNQTLHIKNGARLIDSQSFVWIIQENDRSIDYTNWEPSAESEAAIEWTYENPALQLDDSYNDAAVGIEQTVKHPESKYAQGSGGTSIHQVQSPNRSQEVVRIAKERANGICQLCGKSAPFQDKKGKPYLEVHHVDWLSRGGIDCTDNAVALCPNCHTKMHIVDDSADVEKLKKILSQMR